MQRIESSYRYDGEQCNDRNYFLLYPLLHFSVFSVLSVPPCWVEISFRQERG